MIRGFLNKKRQLLGDIAITLSIIGFYITYIKKDK